MAVRNVSDARIVSVTHEDVVGENDQDETMTTIVVNKSLPEGSEFIIIPELVSSFEKLGISETEFNDLSERIQVVENAA